MAPELPARDIRATEDGFLLKVGSAQFLELGRDLQPTRRISLDSTGIRGVFNWAASADTILAFADVEERSHWKSAWVRLPLDSPGEYEVLREAPIRSLERNLYSLGMSYMTVLDGTTYFLAEASGQFQLFQTARGPARSEVRALPGVLSLEPLLLPFGANADAVVARYKALERSAAPAGLYSHNRKLYLLTRQPAAEGTTWRLHRMSPKTGGQISARILPTHAPHLVVIPGHQRWAIVEKGGVLAPGRQEVLSILLVPAAWFEDEET